MAYVEDLVSIVIPTYKRFDTLERAIKSVANQTYDKIEILVVDDNEPGDEYSQAVRELINGLKIENLVLVTQPKHINGAAARNAGIRSARGEYISFLDDDDIIFPDKIEKQINVLKNLDESVGGVSCLKIFFEDDKPTKVSESWKCTQYQSFEIMSKQLNIQTGTVLLRRKCLDETGYFDENLRRHQEVQLMSYFTDKYKVILIDEVLTAIDGSDLSNRPNYNQLKVYKQDFFSSVNPLMQKYSKRKKRFIINNHKTELAWVMFRDINKTKGLFMLLECFVDINVMISFTKRLIESFKGKSRLERYAKKEYVQKLIKQ